MSPPDAARVLRHCPVFAGLPDKEVAALAAVSVESTYRARDFIFMEGDPARWFCVVVSGRVKILRQTSAGKDVVLELLGPGEIFGGVAALEKRPYPAAAQAVEATVALKIPSEAVAALSERHPSLVREIALLVGRRLRAAHDSVRSLSVDPVEARLAATLLRLVDREGAPAGGGAAVPFRLTRQSLADMSGTTVETAIRVVSRWLRDGLVRDDAGHLVLVEIEALRDLARGGAGEP